MPDSSPRPDPFNPSLDFNYVMRLPVLYFPVKNTPDRARYIRTRVHSIPYAFREKSDRENFTVPPIRFVLLLSPTHLPPTGQNVLGPINRGRLRTREQNTRLDDPRPYRARAPTDIGDIRINRP